MEYMEGGDILTKLDDTERFPEETTWFCAVELTLAVEFCGIIHR